MNCGLQETESTLVKEFNAESSALTHHHVTTSRAGESGVYRAFRRNSRR